jgi:CheY-like chemotaxis protein
MRSCEEGGSTFWFRLPLRSATTVVAQVPAFETDERVLVVDDMEINRRVLSGQLTSWRVRHECADGATTALAALRRAAAAGSPYRLAIIDHMMPEVDGLMLAQQITADPQLRHTAIVIVTSAAQQSLKRYHAGEFLAVLVKPVVRARQLQEVLQSAMHGGPRTMENPPTNLQFSAQGEPVAEQRAEIAEAAPRRVLLTEDNLVNAKLAKRLLERLGCRVDVASNGHEALTMIQSIPFEIVFMDCQMPEMDGFEATRAIREWERSSHIGSSPITRLPIVALTANAMQGDRERCLDAGMDDYITKPINRDDLARILATYRRGETSTASSANAFEMRGASSVIG